MRRATDYEPPPTMTPGWSPAHDDDSPKAADERARKALRETHETRVELGDLKSELAAIAANMSALVKVLKVLGALLSPAVIKIVVNLAEDGYRWLSTFHH
jgi:hypothetical protein